MRILKDFGCIILAAGDRAHPEDAGLGAVSKNLADLQGKPVLQHVINVAKRAGVSPEKTTIVTKPGLRQYVEPLCTDGARIATQEKATGSIDAIRAAHDQHVMPTTEHLLILMGDQPCLNPEKVRSFMQQHRKSGMLVTVSAFQGHRDQTWYQKCGIIHRDPDLNFEAIVRSQVPVHRSQELHAGPWAFDTKWLVMCMMHIPRNHYGEIHVYCAAEAAARVFGVGTFSIGTAKEVLGIDHFEALQHIRSKQR